MRPTVSLSHCPSYSHEVVYRAVKQAIDLLGGVERFFKKGQKVLIKPNLLMGKSPEQAVTTHPSVIQAVAELLIEEGCIPLIGDKPGNGGLEDVVHKAGVGAVLQKTGARLVEFDDYVDLQPPYSSTFTDFKIAKLAKEVDVVVNVPKLKTHAYMLFTLGVKNLFGCVEESQRIQWHLKAGVDRISFGKVLVGVHEIIKPQLTIVDGVVAMEENGPIYGVPRKTDLIIAGDNSIAVDTITARILAPDQELFTTKAALQEGLQGADIDGITLVGSNLSDFELAGFKQPVCPEIVEWGIPLPKSLRRILKNSLTTRPRVKYKDCVLCKTCLNRCPVQAISVDKKAQELRFDYLKCICCFCCYELCPHGAITVEKGLLLKSSLAERLAVILYKWRYF